MQYGGDRNPQCIHSDPTTKQRKRDYVFETLMAKIICMIAQYIFQPYPQLERRNKSFMFNI